MTYPTAATNLTGWLHYELSENKNQVRSATSSLSLMKTSACSRLALIRFILISQCSLLPIVYLLSTNSSISDRLPSFLMRQIPPKVGTDIIVVQKGV